MNNFNNVDTYLEHYGRKGMKWGARVYSKGVAKANSPKAVARRERKDAKALKARLKSDASYEKYKANKPTAAQLKKNRQRAKVVGGVAILAGTAAAGVVLGRRGRIKISDANKLASAKSAKLVSEVGSFFVKNSVDRTILAANVRDIAEGLY
jgi:hypothetical protein